MTTGPAHWELLCKARALDNQVYCATVSPARDETADYVRTQLHNIIHIYNHTVGCEMIKYQVHIIKLLLLT